MTLSSSVAMPERFAARFPMLALSLLLTHVAGCRCDRAPPAPSPAGSCPAVAAAAGSAHRPILAPRDVAVALLSPGHEPRRVLRYQLVEGTHFAFEVSPIQREDDRGNAGRTTIHVEGTVACVAVSGARLDYRLGLNGAVREGASAYALVSERGVIERGGLLSVVDLDVDERGLTHPREGLAPPLPAEPVGVSAVWEVSRTLDSGERQRFAFEIVSMDDTTLTTRTQVRLSALGGEEEAVQGHGETTIELRSPVAPGWFLMQSPQGGEAGLRVDAL